MPNRLPTGEKGQINRREAYPELISFSPVFSWKNRALFQLQCTIFREQRLKLVPIKVLMLQQRLAEQCQLPGMLT